MYQVAVFIDAGYFYKQGMFALSGKDVRRESIDLDVRAMLSELSDHAREVSEGARLLRIYWYDGVARYAAPSIAQKEVAEQKDIKCWFGVLNSGGVQKGVDSLLVVDLIELSRNKAITDAVVMSGDEDIRLGVQVAQTFGVRVHLLGIDGPQYSQSLDLVIEADTHTLWSKRRLENWMRSLEPTVVDADQAPTVQNERLQAAVLEVIRSLSDSERKEIVSSYDRSEWLPPQYDSKLLSTVSDAVGRELTSEERAHSRSDLVAHLRNKL